jgi:hypothetical protein
MNGLGCECARGHSSTSSRAAGRPTLGSAPIRPERGPDRAEVMVRFEARACWPGLPGPCRPGAAVWPAPGPPPAPE